MTNTAQEKELYAKLKNKALIQLRFLTGDADERDKLKEIDDYLYGLMKPKMYWGSEGVEVQFDKSFESTCTVIEQHLNYIAKELTAFEYLSKIEDLKKQFDGNKK